MHQKLPTIESSSIIRPMGSLTQPTFKIRWIF